MTCFLFLVSLSICTGLFGGLGSSFLEEHIKFSSLADLIGTMLTYFALRTSGRVQIILFWWILSWYSFSYFSFFWQLLFIKRDKLLIDFLNSYPLMSLIVFDLTIESTGSLNIFWKLLLYFVKFFVFLLFSFCWPIDLSIVLKSLDFVAS